MKCDSSKSGELIWKIAKYVQHAFTIKKFEDVIKSQFGDVIFYLEKSTNPALEGGSNFSLPSEDPARDRQWHRGQEVRWKTWSAGWTASGIENPLLFEDDPKKCGSILLSFPP